MPQSLETVKIVNPKDKKGETFVIVNRADFNPKTMTLWEEAQVQAKAQAEAKTPEAEGTKKTPRKTG